MIKKIDIIYSAIDYFGGRKQFADKVGVSYRTILDWSCGRAKISPLNAIKIENITEGAIKREDLLPDYSWDNLR